ncbi:MAG TPA: trypsin-like peptidase domain-containing protein [Jatrophihabitantaceae bacterium]|jgi:S1-C subfamily serine protease
MEQTPDSQNNQPPWQPDPYPYWYPYPYPYQQPEPPRRRHRGALVAAGLGLAAAAVAVGLGISAATSGTSVVSAQGSASPANPPSAANTSTGTATAAQQVGVVDIDTVLGYQGAEAAGTGMILTSSGEILTNNHVIDGATSIKVTVVTSGATYTAKVVGTDPSDDVAVLQLQGASGLQTAKIGNSSDVNVGDAVTAVGNAGGVGGTPSAANGSVVALNQSLTASNENGSNAETLTGMIEINAPVVSGDSGGPLYDSNDKVVGMDTAASSAFGYGGGQTAAYAIPINKALGIADKIESGQASSTIHIGNPAFLGVSLQDSASGAVVASVAAGTPAASAGLQVGDVITSVDGKSVSSAQSLATTIAGHHPGDRISLGWTDAFGQSHTATITLATGPAD